MRIGTEPRNSRVADAAECRCSVAQPACSVHLTIAKKYYIYPMHSEEKMALLALSYVPKLGIKSVKDLVNHVGSAKEVWELSRKEKAGINGMKSSVASHIGSTKIWDQMLHELAFCDAHNIAVNSCYESDYPELLKECVDAPLVVFCRGKLNLSDGKFVAIVGTRKMTSRGREFVNELIEGFRNQPITIVSGLAMGVDAQAHKMAIANEIQTIGVLAHGVNQIFPKSNEKIGREMLRNGGLISEFSTFHAAEPENFLRRNRVIAGLCEATIVIESGIAGGAMSTARHANNYNRDVFAVPGRTTDISAAGCHHLIKNHQAFLMTNAMDVLSYLNISPKKKKRNLQQELFVELSPSEKELYDLLKRKGKLHIDMLAMEMNLATYQLMPILLDLELKHLVEPLPGKFYDLV